jgi:opacity protein-like surface antigen
MKKLLLASALALTFTSAFADPAGWSSVTTYNYDKASNTTVDGYQQQVVTGVALGTEYGTFGAGVVYRGVSTVSRDDQLGFELGYANGFKVDAFTIRGRVAVGQINQVNSVEYPGNISYYSLAAEAQYPVMKDIGAYAGYRYRGSMNGTEVATSRYTIGGDFAIDKNMLFRVGYAYTAVAKTPFVNSLNGLDTAFVYKF